MPWFFGFFIVSGFCSLVYQVTWLRVAMTAFGVTTPQVAIVLSVFMAGLALGSWGGGGLVSRMKHAAPGSFLRLYAVAELVIGLSGFIVAPLLGVGHDMLMKSTGAGWGSGSYYLLSGVMITVVLLPFCTCMGATFPLAMAAVRGAFEDKSGTSFSYLYIANVIGAMAGGFCSAFILIELLGFRGTMMAAAVLNLLVALLATVVSSKKAYTVKTAGLPLSMELIPLPTFREHKYLILLFITGLVSLAMEVVWTRQFVPFLGPVVYTFASILVIYLAATLFGSRIYRSWFRQHPLLANRQGWQLLAGMAAAAALLPLVAADPRLPIEVPLAGIVRVIIGIGPFCALLGFMTPALLDRVSSGDPGRAGFAYALNTIGCIVGPLMAGFLLLPHCGERWSLALLALPLFAFGAISGRNSPGSSAGLITATRFRSGMLLISLSAVFIVAFTSDFEMMFPGDVVLRDHTATVIAGKDGMDSLLLVNGIGMTKLTPITKMMVHLPLASLESPPQKGLVLCLGMGTSFRSMMSWNIPSTVVELVPSIPRLLPLFHADGRDLLTAPGGRIVVDDARRFLEYTRESFSVIVVDPPPPIEAAANSLLHSREFYAAASRRLAPGGILQQWIPWEGDGFKDKYLLVAMTRALTESFPYVRAFKSVEGWGLHFIASNRPIPVKTPEQMAALLPENAAADLVEWGPFPIPAAQFAEVLSQEVPVGDIIAHAPEARALADDRPINEYYLVRRLFH